MTVRTTPRVARTTAKLAKEYVVIDGYGRTCGTVSRPNYSRNWYAYSCVPGSIKRTKHKTRRDAVQVLILIRAKHEKKGV